MCSSIPTRGLRVVTTCFTEGSSVMIVALSEGVHLMNATALILAAGEGTRMKSVHAKATHELLDKPLVRWAVDAARAAGCKRVITVVGHGADEVVPLVSDTEVVLQSEQRGTGHAVMCAREALRGVAGSLVVLNGDSPLLRAETIRALVSAREREGAAIEVLTMEMDDPTGYGRIIRGAGDVVEGIVEQRDCTPEQALIRECNSGAYCFDAHVLLERIGELSTDNAQGEYYLTDVLALCRDDGLEVHAMLARDASETMGVNSRLQLAQATKVMQGRINEAHMAAGVTMLDPGQVWIGPDVVIASDVELLPQTFLWGATAIDSGSVVGPNSRLTDTVVGHDCRVDETVAVDARIDDGATCGPRAYLRSGTHICDGAKVGTHVEIKKSTIGRGSKVPHLSYIGDTVMGEGVNVGAGTITCNYDGVHKWPTTIGDGAFIGSDTMLVAPVAVGDGALVGAGSTITKDVPAGALALERSQQRTIEGWAAKRRQQQVGEDDRTAGTI